MIVLLFIAGTARFSSTFTSFVQQSALNAVVIFFPKSGKHPFLTPNHTTTVNQGVVNGKWCINQCDKWYKEAGSIGCSNPLVKRRFNKVREIDEFQAFQVMVLIMCYKQSMFQDFPMTSGLAMSVVVGG